MSKNELLLLIGEIKSSLIVLGKINRLYSEYQSVFGDANCRELRDAVLLAEILSNTYTCVETILLRISRVFENHLDGDRWHKHLLSKMRIEIPGVRQAVITHQTFVLLDELRRFRRFQRYYYEFDYDWARLDYLMTVYDRLTPVLTNDLDVFITFLLNCVSNDNGE